MYALCLGVVLIPCLTYVCFQVAGLIKVAPVTALYVPVIFLVTMPVVILCTVIL